MGFSAFSKDIRPIITRFIFLFVAPPAIALSVKGGEALLSSGIDKLFIGIWLVTLFVFALYFVVVKLKARRAKDVEIEDYVKPGEDWGSAQTEIWLELDKLITKCLSENAQWSSLRLHGLTIARAAASKLENKGRHAEYSATAPEILLMLETLSSRFRRVLMERLPLVEAINISTLLKLYDQRDHLETIQRGYNAYRTFRVFAPQGIISEMAGWLFANLADTARDNLVYNLKRAFLKEVSGVAIDLYSGKFKVANSEFIASKTSDNDLTKLVGVIEPIRVCIVGQVSSGKSTLVNSLLDEVKAEVSALPATDRSAVYEVEIKDGITTRFVDTLGIDGEKKTSKLIIAEMMESDIIVWTLKANQSARAPDTSLLELFHEEFDNRENRFRKRPCIIGVLTHMDKLIDINSTSEPTAKEALDTSMDSVISYNRETLELDFVAPTANIEGLNWGLEYLVKLFSKQHDDAVHVLLGRLRHQGNAGGIGKKDIGRTGRMVESAVKMGLNK